MLKNRVMERQGGTDYSALFRKLSAERGVARMVEAAQAIDPDWKGWCSRVFPQQWAMAQAASKRANAQAAAKDHPRAFSASVHEYLDRIEKLVRAFRTCNQVNTRRWPDMSCFPPGKTLVFDIETQRLFNEVGGREAHHIRKLGVFLIGAFFHPEDKYYVFGENGIDEFIERAGEVDLIVGFNHLYFDLEVLRGYREHELEEKTKQFDIMIDCEQALHRRPSLDGLCLGTFREGKSDDAVDTVLRAREGDVDRLSEYLLNDVRLTLSLFAYGCEKSCVLWRNPRTKTDDRVVEIPAAGWKLGQQRTQPVGQMRLDGSVDGLMPEKKATARRHR